MSQARDDESERDLEPSEQKGPEGERIEPEGPAPGEEAPERDRAERSREVESVEPAEEVAEDERDFAKRNVGGKGSLEP